MTWNSWTMAVFDAVGLHSEHIVTSGLISGPSDAQGHSVLRKKGWSLCDSVSKVLARSPLSQTSEPLALAGWTSGKYLRDWHTSEDTSQTTGPRSWRRVAGAGTVCVCWSWTPCFARGVSELPVGKSESWHDTVFKKPDLVTLPLRPVGGWVS